MSVNRQAYPFLTWLVLPGNAPLGCPRPEVKGLPLYLHVIFLLESFDPIQADVAPGSDIVGVDFDFNGLYRRCHTPSL